MISHPRPAWTCPTLNREKSATNLDLVVSDLVLVIDVAKIKYQEFHADDAGCADFHGSDPREFAKSAESAWKFFVLFFRPLPDLCSQLNRGR
jgi:hypothetical protein